MRGSVLSQTRYSMESICVRCGDSSAYRTPREGLFEYLVLPLLFFQAYRCCRCGERQYFSSFGSLKFVGSTFRYAALMGCLAVGLGFLALRFIDSLAEAVSAVFLRR